MSFERQILVIALMSLLAFFYDRGFILGIKNYQLNNSAYKKRKKGETIGEWFLYTRYRDIIPKGWIIFYFILLALHVLCFIICIVVNFTSQSKIGEIVAIFTFFFDVAWVLVLHILFWSKKPGYAYERWIQKKRGQDPANKKK